MGDTITDMIKKIRKGDPAPGDPWKFWKEKTENGVIYYYFKLSSDAD
jgi:hypothetical protein